MGESFENFKIKTTFTAIKNVRNKKRSKLFSFS